MPITYEIVPERRYVETTMAPPVDLEDVLEYYRQLFADPAFRHEFDGLVVVGGAIRGWTPDQVQTLARVIRRSRFPPSRRALVSDDPEICHLLGEFARLTVALERRFRVFRTRDEALRWLDESARGAPGAPPPPEGTG